MKKIALFLLAVTLIMTGMTAPAESSKQVYASDFTRDADGWYGRGARSYLTGNGTLLTEGRTMNWNSPGRDFPLVEGARYVLSVEVCQDGKDSAGFMISIAHTADGVETYENLARGTAKKGEWTRLTGTYTAGEFDRYVLYVETTDAADLSFEIRNFTVSAPDGEPEPKVTEPPMVIEAAEDVPSLKDAYAGKFDIGAAVPQTAFYNPKLREMIIGQYSILTPENELKPNDVLDVAASRKLAEETGDETAVAVHFDSARALLNFAQENGIKVHGHVLVWHEQTPESFFHEGYDTSRPLVSREVMLGRLENYIREVLTRTEELYPGVIVSWDVVNEAIDNGGLRKSTWYKVVGEDFAARAFEYARKYAAEGVLLYYNDYGTAYPDKLNAIVRLLGQLIAEGNIDGYGFQMHHQLALPSMDMITAAVEKIAGLGLKLRVSELDIETSKATEESLMKQKEKYKAIMKLMLRFSDQTEAVQVWGLTDSMSWLGESKHPLLFDRNRNPKPAFYGVLEAAEEE